MKKPASAPLGDHPISKKTFADLDLLLKEFQTDSFRTLSEKQRREKISQVLLERIQKEKEPCFLLAAVLEFIEKVDQAQVVSRYTFGIFESWLNHFSSLSFEENYRVRAKIVGKWIERNDYQALFPIGMGKVYEGSHFVTAHKSPDLDTTVASFWGWMDAFGARVGNGLHVWNLPGGPPASQIEIDWIFVQVFGNSVFTHLSKNRTALNITANDLMTQKGLLRKLPTDSIREIDHDRDLNAVVVVDERGFYIGDWRNFDVESFSQMMNLLGSCLRWFENRLNLHLVTLFAKKALHYDEIQPLLEKLFYLKLQDCDPAKEFTLKQKQQIGDFLRSVLKMQEGLEGTFEQLGLQLAQLGEAPFDGLQATLSAMKQAQLFDGKGHLSEERPSLFTFLEKTIRALHQGVFKIRSRLEKLDIALRTKYEVFGRHPTYVTSRTDLEEIRTKIGSYPYLTVIHQEQQEREPVGVIQAADLRKNLLGTVSLRDFCNRDEMTIPPYLEVISVIDHHKSSLNTFTPPMAIIADVQSCNTLVAQKAFQINDRYSLRGQTEQDLEEQIRAFSQDASPVSTRILNRLLQKRLNVRKKGFFIDPQREFTEYLHFLYAILDDTDLLSKVSDTDVECVVSLLNRMKSIQLGQEVELLDLEDLPRDKSFAKKAAQRILQNEEMYSLYRKVYAFREKEVEKNLTLSAAGQTSNLFADTKEQNGCCRIGQTKLFANNMAHFEKEADAIRKGWLETAKGIYQDKPEIALHMHMISTIVSAEEVYRGTQGKYTHQDELWLWVPQEEMAIERLKRFLSAFQASAGLKDNPLSVEFLGDNADELAHIFKESFLDIPQKRSSRKLPIAILRYRAGSLNSRKAMVSPFLPTGN